jgi:hypothetical protein
LLLNGGSGIKIVGETPDAYRSYYRELSVSIADIIRKSLPKDKDTDEK